MMPDWIEAMDSLRLLLGHLGTEGSAHDRAIILIHEAISLGINTGRGITTALHQLGFDKRHVGIWLSRQTGPNPNGNHWFRDGDGRYHSHP
jgi:hypothetical protein